MKYVYTVIIIIVSFWSCKSDFKDVSLEQITVGKGEYSYTETDTARQYFLVTNDIHWQHVKSKVSGGTITDPSIDFSMYTILGIIDRVQPSNGFSADIVSVIEEEDDIVVKSDFSSPVGGSATVLTRPYHFVKVPKIDKPVVFEK